MRLIALDIEGEWNVPLLRNAAELSGASLTFAVSNSAHPIHDGAAVELFETAIRDFDLVIACETGPRTKSFYDYVPHGQRIAVVVGNEERGIPKSVLKECHDVVSIPMYGEGMSSVNVAVSAGISLYVLAHDFGRKGRRKKTDVPRPDILVETPNDPAEIGSFLRSVWAFGWHRIHLTDPMHAWFSEERERIALSRAAARKEKNPLVVLPSDTLQPSRYDRIILCGNDCSGIPLSKYALPDGERPLLTYGMKELPDELASLPMEHIYVDHTCAATVSRFRHGGSILLSVLSQQVGRTRHG